MDNQLMNIKEKIILDDEYKDWMKKISNIEDITNSFSIFDILFIQFLY